MSRSYLALDLLPAAIRADKRIRIQTLPPELAQTGVWGMVGQAQGKTLVLVPSGPQAAARVIRTHEAIHVNIAQRKKRGHIPALLHECVEDVRVHSAVWPTSVSEQLNRDVQGFAWKEIRSIEHFAKDMSNPQVHDGSLHSSLRALAMLEGTRYQHIGRAAGRVDRAMGYPVAKTLLDIIRFVVARDYERAEDIMLGLLRSPANLVQLFSLVGGRISGPGHYDDPVKDEEVGEEWPMDEYMQIITLSPMTERTKAIWQRKKVLASSGIRINGRRLAQAFIGQSTTHLFRRKERVKEGGAILIDASGSMHISDSDLSGLCDIAPGLAVAYYAGEDSGTNFPSMCGTLWIYAERGKHYSGSLPRRPGGNGVDYFALRWLLRQPGPRVFVTDGGFSGGPNEAPKKAMAVLKAAVARKEVVWVRTIEGAWDEFRRRK